MTTSKSSSTGASNKVLILNYLSAIAVLFSMVTCTPDDQNNPEDCPSGEFFCEYDSRNFEMGFTTWPYAPTPVSVEDTYQFILDNSDIYSEHIDLDIPWDAWMNDLPLPTRFADDIANRSARKISEITLTVSVSVLNNARTELAFDYDGSVPEYASLDDPHIADAYCKHLQYIVDLLDPDYLLVGIESNELYRNVPEKWEAYKRLMSNVRARIKEKYPSLKISESITLHNFYEPDVPNPDILIDELTEYANSLDFVTISFYPFFKGLKTKNGFQEALDFLHTKVNRPIAIAETGHLSENLDIASFNLSIDGSQSEQNEYLESLLQNAQEKDYEYIIWWTHRDYNELWETFPDEVKDLGQLWMSTGIINEDGAEKEAFATWQSAFNK